MKTNKYIITYHKNDVQIIVVRNAEDATQAIKKLCEQYKWNWKTNLVDADTCGKKWCEALIDKDGGINYSMRLIAVRKD